MKCKEIISVLEELAPISYAENWDNVGLLLGNREKEVKRIMIALEVTSEVVHQAAAENIDMLITHHPLIYSPMKRVTYEDFTGRRVINLIQQDIAYYAMHTNFDATIMAEAAAKQLLLQNVTILEPNEVDEKVGIGRYGTLNEKMSLEQCGAMVKERLGLEYVKMVGDPKKEINLVAVCPGSGKSYVNAALSVGADVLISGDIDHHSAVDAKEQGLSIIDGGHFGTEYLMVNYMQQYMEDYFKKKSSKEEDIKVFTAKEEGPFWLL